MTDDNEEARQIGQPARAVGERIGAGAHERRPQQQVFGRIAAQTELRREDEARTLLVSTASGIDDLVGVAGEVADDGIDLRQRHLHGHCI